MTELGPRLLVCVCVYLCGGGEEDMEVLAQFSNASKLSNVPPPPNAAANV